MAQIHELLKLIREEIGAIPKAHKADGSAGGYNYRGIDDVINNVGPIFTKHGVLALPKVLSYSTNRLDGVDKHGKPRATYESVVDLQVTFVAPDGSREEISAIGGGLDFSDKSSGKAMSFAMKHALLLGLQIPVDRYDLDDPDRDSASEYSAKPVRGSNGNGDHPNDSASVIVSAISAVRNSPSEASLDKCAKRAQQKLDAGEFTAGEFKRLEAEIAKRRAELTPAEATK